MAYDNKNRKTSGNDKEDENQGSRTGATLKLSYQRREGNGKVTVDRPCMNGYNYSARYGLVTFVAVPKNDFETKNDKWQEWVVTCKHPGPVLPFKTTGFWDGETLHMPDLQMIARAKTRTGDGEGGYWGKNHK